MGKTTEAILAISKIPGVCEMLKNPDWIFEELLEIPGVAEELDKHRASKHYLNIPSPLHVRRKIKKNSGCNLKPATR